jgi:hypothetical protein
MNNIIWNTFLFSSGLICIFLFYIDIFLPIWASSFFFIAVSLLLWLRYLERRIGLLVLLLWLAYSLPFIHIFPYLWFDFANEVPEQLWGLKSNPYMLDEMIVKLTAMIGAVGAIGFAIGIFINNKIIHQNISLREDEDLLHNKTLSIYVWMIWIFLGLVFSWLVAPSDTLFVAEYTQSVSILENANFGSAWMVSYIILAFAFCDAVLDNNSVRRLIKKIIFFGVIFFIAIYFQFLRGDRAIVPFLLSIVIVYFYWAPSIKQKRRIKFKAKHILLTLFAILVLLITSNILGATRHSLVEANDISQFFDIVYPFFILGSADFSGIFHGTWSAVLLTPLSVAGDHIYKVLPLKFGEDYLNFLLSIPPGFVADALGYLRPIEDGTGPPREMIYGQGGTHASVVPFMNFRMFGVLIIPALWAFIINHCENYSLKFPSIVNLALLCTIALAIPHWFWYGEKYGMNALIIWFLLTFFYKLSLRFVISPQANRPQR